MKTDVRGCSTCARGEENYELFYSSISKREFFQYEYRAPDGELFACVSKTLEECRKKCESWLMDRSH